MHEVHLGFRSLAGKPHGVLRARYDDLFSERYDYIGVRSINRFPGNGKDFGGCGHPEPSRGVSERGGSVRRYGGAQRRRALGYTRLRV